MRELLIAALICAAVLGLPAPPQGTSSASGPGPAVQLYRVELVQAAPGRLLELIDLLRTHAALVEAAGDTPPFWMRHSQGDRWDLLLLYPMGNYLEYYSAERVARRARAEAAAPELAARIRAAIAWQEDAFMYGPPLDALKAAFANAGFFHVEMMHALPGKLAELRTEREMESAFQKQLHRPELFIFVRDQGAAWDILSIDFYRDLKHYAESADIPAEQQEAAARAAGFPSASQIGPYLRTLIASHHDTLAVALSPAPRK
jgi:hypothetical protein